MLLKMAIATESVRPGETSGPPRGADVKTPN
jgi:hypothetical protein